MIVFEIDTEIVRGELSFKQIAVKHDTTLSHVNMVAEQMADRVEYDEDYRSNDCYDEVYDLCDY